MKKTISLIFTVLICINSYSQEKPKGIIETLEILKKGYAERDTSKLDEWYDSIFYEDAELLGTYAVEPGKVEWKNDKNESLKAFKRDWVGWGDLSIDLSKAHINYYDNFAWISFPAVVTRNPNNSRSRTADESYSNMLKNFDKIIENNKSDLDSEAQLHLIAHYANLVMYQYSIGEEYIWPIRISCVLQKENNKWKFRQIHFSHPNRGFPNVRY